MEKIRLVASDLDGTIVREDNTISKITKNILEKLEGNNVLFLPCTGRSYQDMQSVLPKELLSYAILLNGALFVDAFGHILESRPMSQKNCKIVEECCHIHQMPCLYFSEHHIYGIGDLTQMNHCAYSYYADSYKGNYYTQEVQEVASFQDIDEAILKMETIHVDLQKVDEMRMELMKQPAIQVSSSLPYNIEITEKKVNKAQMLDQVLKRLNCKREELLFFGDSTNDLEVFTKFPYCIAVDNAIQEIKELAYAQCDSCEEDGVAKFLESYILKER